MAFVDLEKAFDWVPWKVIWQALRKLGVEEWIVRLVQGMYANARSCVHVGEGYSEEFEVKVGVHQGSVLSPLLFIIVLEALSREFRSGVPWEDLNADDLIIITESLEECVRRLLTWKEAMEKKGLRVNAGKTKIMQGLTNQKKKNPPAHWASKIFFHLPSSNSYLPRICATQIPICPRFANRNRSPTFNIALTSLWKQYSCKSQIIYRKVRF